MCQLRAVKSEVEMSNPHGREGAKRTLYCSRCVNAVLSALEPGPSWDLKFLSSKSKRPLVLLLQLVFTAQTAAQVRPSQPRCADSARSRVRASRRRAGPLAARAGHQQLPATEAAYQPAAVTRPGARPPRPRTYTPTPRGAPSSAPRTQAQKIVVVPIAPLPLTPKK